MLLDGLLIEGIDLGIDDRCACVRECDEIWIGAIAKAGGAVGVAKFEAAAKAGVYFQQTGGAISDYGFKASAEVDAQAAGVIRSENKVELKISCMNTANSGPSASSTTKFGPLF
ncbi:hypothetical protein BH11MYX2_BH11MYX2_00840 [soil metagenome]